MKLKSLLCILIASSTITTQSRCYEISGRTVAFAALSSLILAKVIYDLYYRQIDNIEQPQNLCMCCNNNDSENSDDDDSSRRRNESVIEKNDPEHIFQASQDDIVWRDRFCQIGDLFNG